jgi:hypothetical protein
MKSDSSRPWPRGLRREAAADYIGVSATKFDDWVARGIMPKPKRQDGVVVWDRLALDAAFDDLPSDGEQRGGWARSVEAEPRQAPIPPPVPSRPAPKTSRAARQETKVQATLDALAAVHALPDDVPWRQLDCCAMGFARGEFEFHSARCKAMKDQRGAEAKSSSS